MSAASPAFPDIPGEPAEVFDVEVPGITVTADSLATLHRSGDWSQLQTVTRQVLGALVDSTGHSPNFSRDYYSVVLLGEQLDGKPSSSITWSTRIWPGPTR